MTSEKITLSQLEGFLFKSSATATERLSAASAAEWATAKLRAATGAEQSSRACAAGQQLPVRRTMASLWRFQFSVAPVADDELPDRKIAQKVGVSQPTIYVWRAKPEFMGRVDERVAAYRKEDLHQLLQATFLRRTGRRAETARPKAQEQAQAGCPARTSGASSTLGSLGRSERH